MIENRDGSLSPWPNIRNSVLIANRQRTLARDIANDRTKSPGRCLQARVNVEDAPTRQILVIEGTHGEPASSTLNISHTRVWLRDYPDTPRIRKC
jgi:hypothetical protein